MDIPKPPKDQTKGIVEEKMPETCITLGRPTCTAIVCAYNEEMTLADVLNVLLESHQVDEIVVVDDGSTDNTLSVMNCFANHEKVRSISLLRNRGKGHAMAEGILNAQGKILLFVDADLLNLDTAYIDLILAPLLAGETDMVIGYPSRGPDMWNVVNPFRPLSGERAVFRKDILPLVALIRDSRYGVETLINLHYRREGKRVCYIPLRGLIHPIKLEKNKPSEALEMYTREAFQIAQAVAGHHPFVISALRPDGGGTKRLWNEIIEHMREDLLARYLQQACRDAKRTVSQFRESPRRGL